MTLGGSTFIYNGNKFDYNYRETIACLLALCDQVVVCVAESDDGTLEEVFRISRENAKLKVLHCHEFEWFAKQKMGRERLSYFSNFAIEALETDWNFYLQGDEILHQDSFKFVREAMETDNEAFMVTRLNLWRDPFHYLNVPVNRQPCSTQVIRLAKKQYRCYNDAESLDAQANFEFVRDIQIYHCGFVRKREVMKGKIINMQREVFQMSGHDPKLDKSEIFDPLDYFSESDLSPIPKPLPKFVQRWAAERYRP